MTNLCQFVDPKSGERCDKPKDYVAHHIGRIRHWAHPFQPEPEGGPRCTCGKTRRLHDPTCPTQNCDCTDCMYCCDGNPCVSAGRDADSALSPDTSQAKPQHKWKTIRNRREALEAASEAKGERAFMSAEEFYRKVWIPTMAHDIRGDWPIRFAEAYAQARERARDERVK